jgi:hypothetical protein
MYLICMIHAHALQSEFQRMQNAVSNSKFTIAENGPATANRAGTCEETRLLVPWRTKNSTRTLLRTTASLACGDVLHYLCNTN